MSVRGIDTQIMVTRSADYSRDVGAMNKKPELTQEQLAALHKANVAHEQKKIVETKETDMDKIRTDKDGSGSGAGGGSSEGQPDEEDTYASSNAKGSGSSKLVSGSEHIIDIKV